MTGSSQQNGKSDRLVGLRVVVDAALRVAEARGERVVIVGGFVRDLLLQRAVGDYDLDLVVEGDGLSFSRALQGEIGGDRREHPSFLTSKLFAPFSSVAGESPFLSEVDVATARSEEYAKPGALPIVKPTSLEQDLWRRDFAINAMALPLAAYRDLIAGLASPESLFGRVVDPCAGLADARNKVLRILHPRSFVDDPTRLFRAVRYVTRLSFNFDKATLAGFYEAVRSGALATLSPRRVWNEVVCALDEEAPGEVVQEFADRGLFSFLPVVDAARASRVVEALTAIASHRALVDEKEFQETGRLVMLACLIEEGREDIANAVSEGGKMIRRAKSVLMKRSSSGGACSPSEALAMYGLHGDNRLLDLLRGSAPR